MQANDIVSENPQSTVVAQYERTTPRAEAYQSEAELEQGMIAQLQRQGYEYAHIHHEDELIQNLRLQLEKLNDFHFSDNEWERFFKAEIANEGKGIVDKAETIQRDNIKAFTLDDGTQKNIYLIDQQDPHHNSTQVINQYEVSDGKRPNRYDVTILVNGGLQIHDRDRQAGQAHLVLALLRAGQPGIHPKLFLLMKETLDLRGLNFEEGYIAVIDKPLSWTSTDVVRKIKSALRRLGYRKIKVGHAGTLDPLATGVLLVCIGRATKMVDALQAEEKEYVADVMLGATTPSYDLEHPVDATFPTQHITRGKVLEALAALSGERLQSPPVYSAKKIDGMRAYELARAGEEVEMRKALVHIYEMQLEEYDLPRIRIRVRCSKGTYIRSLAHEIGQALESGAHLTSLCRTRSGGFRVENAHSLDDFLKKLQELETK